MGRRSEPVSAREVAGWHKDPPKSAKACGDGLYFRPSDGGRSQWAFRYMLNGRARWVSLGHYPDKSLAKARDDARRVRVQVRDGRDVAEVQRKERLSASNALTVAQLIDDYYAHQVEPQHQEPTVTHRRLKNHILPVIGKLRLDEVGPQDVDKVLRKLRAQYPTVANDVLADLKKMFKFAAKRSLMDTNPAANFDKDDAGGREEPRRRFLESAELSSLVAAMHNSRRFGRVNTISVQMLLALCVRKMELLAARWEEFDLDDGLWYMPDGDNGAKASRRKKRAVVIPLAPLVVDWLNELKVFAAGSEWVFPARRVSRQRRNPHVSPCTLNAALKNTLDPDVAHFTVHDLRRTAKTHLMRLGVSREVAEKALNHKPPRIEDVYDRYDYLDERREALCRWLGELESLGVH